MRNPSPLLCLLLMLSVVFNGLAFAMPAHAAAMQHGEASGPAEAVAPAHPAAHEAATPPCHESAVDAAGEDASIETVAAAPVSPEAPHEPALSGCCDAGQCDGVCLQASCAMLSMAALGAAYLPPALTGNQQRLALPSHTPSAPIRPPIG